MRRTLLRIGVILLLSGLMIALGSSVVISEMNEMVGGGMAVPFVATQIGESNNYSIETMGLSFVFEGEMVKAILIQSKEAVENFAGRLYENAVIFLDNKGYFK